MQYANSWRVFDLRECLPVEMLAKPLPVRHFVVKPLVELTLCPESYVVRARLL